LSPITGEIQTEEIGTGNYLNMYFELEYEKGNNMIILYVGENLEIIHALEEFVGSNLQGILNRLFIIKNDLILSFLSPTIFLLQKKYIKVEQIVTEVGNRITLLRNKLCKT